MPAMIRLKVGHVYYYLQLTYSYIHADWFTGNSKSSVWKLFLATYLVLKEVPPFDVPQ